jgi:uncharacterized LabA/DUF88 family protein
MSLSRYAILVLSSTAPTSQNQEAYLRALSTTPLVEIILGKFKQKRVRCGVPQCTWNGDRLYNIPEEKRTDVNIAIFMVDDAYQNRCDHFILFSGDSDLVPALNMVKLRFPAKRITVYVPSRNPVRGAAVEIRSAADLNRTLPLNILAKSQFPDQVPDGAGGLIMRPADWT